MEDNTKIGARESGNNPLSSPRGHVYRVSNDAIETPRGTDESSCYRASVDTDADADSTYARHVPENKPNDLIATGALQYLSSPDQLTCKGQ